MIYILNGKSYVTKSSNSCDGCVFEREPIEFCRDSGAHEICTRPPTVIFVEASAQTQDGTTASYYQLPEDAKELQDLISFKNMNAQVGEAFRSLYRMNDCPHSDAIRNCNKVIFYMQAEITRLKKYGP